MRNRYLFLLAAAMVGLAGCSGDGESTSDAPQVRALNAILADPIANVQVGPTTVATGLPYATESGSTRSPYVSSTIGAQSFTFQSGTTTFATGSANLLPSQSVNVIATPNNSAQVIVLTDDTSIATGSEVRVVNASSAAILPSADVVFGPQDGLGVKFTVATNSVFPVQPASPGFLYKSMDSVPYQVQVFPTGSIGTPLLSEIVTLVAGQRWTFVVVDSNTSPGGVELLQIQDSPQISVALASPSKNNPPKRYCKVTKQAGSLWSCIPF